MADLFLSASAGDLSDLEAIAATVSGKDNVAGDAAVIGSKARELEQLVPKILARQAARTDSMLDPQSMPLDTMHPLSLL